MESNKPQNILAINASLRGTRGVSHFLISKIFEGAEAHGASCEAINLAEMNLRHCTGCKKCQILSNAQKCIFDSKDDVALIFEKIRKADIIIYATPIYVFGLSSLLKILLERTFYTAKVDQLCITENGLIFHDIDASISSKPFVSLILCDNIEALTTKNTALFFKTYSNFTNSTNIGQLIRPSAHLLQAKEVETEQQIVIRQIEKAYVQSGRELALKGYISKKTQKIANQDIIVVPKIVKLLLKLGIGRSKLNEKLQAHIQRH